MSIVMLEDVAFQSLRSHDLVSGVDSRDRMWNLGITKYMDSPHGITTISSKCFGLWSGNVLLNVCHDNCSYRAFHGRRDSKPIVCQIQGRDRDS